MRSNLSDVAKQPTTKRGRPPNPELLERIMACGQAHFIEQGFEATSMESIARSAGVSKMTIYRHFATKEALFESCVAQRTDQVFSMNSIERRPPNSLQQVQVVLHDIATEFVKLLLDPEILAMQRTFIANALNHPKPSQTFYEQGCLRLRSQVSEFLLTAHQLRVLYVPDAILAASQFLGMCLSSYHLKGLLAQGESSVDEACALVDQHIDVFLRAYAVPSV